MNKLEFTGLTIAKACKGNPVSATVLVIVFYIMFNQLESAVEFLIAGKRFTHWFDPVFICLFIAYAGYAVWWCGLLNEAEQQSEAQAEHNNGDRAV